MSPPRHIFVSYSHKDELWKDRLLRALAPAGADDGIEVWNDRKIPPGTPWYSEISNAMDRASLALCLVSANFLKSDFCVREEIGQLLSRRERDGLRVICILISPCAWQKVVWMKSLQMLPGDGKSVQTDFAGREDEVLAAAASSIRQILDDPAYQPSSVVSQVAAAEENLEQLRDPNQRLLGRHEELADLDLAWSEHAENVLVLHGPGGLGKTTLVCSWLREMERDGYRGAQKVFGWTFTNAQSGDLFMVAALAWFGDADPGKGSPWDKGERLANLVAGCRTLLVLDRLEAVQQLSGIEKGRLLHPGIATLLWSLGRHNPGLCIVTTRERIAEVEDLQHASQVSLDQLTIEAGAALLRAGGVAGSKDVVLKIVAQLNADPLALTLLSGCIRDGEFIKTTEGLPGVDGESDQLPSVRVLGGIEKQLAASNPKALAALRMLALFDNGATTRAIDAIRARPAIPTLTENVPAPGIEGWREIVDDLRTRKLVFPPNRGDADTIDLHPVVREYFAGQFRQELPEAWKKANSRLFFHYASSRGPDDTMEHMRPLFAAVRYGCRAGHYEPALDVFQTRIQRNKEDYATIKLGASVAILEALAEFFGGDFDRDPPFGRGGPEEDEMQGYVWSQAGGNLRRQGELTKASALWKRCLEVDKTVYGMSSMFGGSRRALKYALACGIDANTIAEHYLAAGPLSTAFQWAREADQWIAKTSDTFRRVVVLTTIGEILHRHGEPEGAAEAFGDAEKIHAGMPRLLPELYQAQGARYCEYLFDQGEYSEVERRARNMVDVERSRTDEDSDKWDVDICQGLLVLARAQLALSKVEEAEVNLEQALLLIRRSVDAYIEAQCLHARATIRWHKGEQARAWADLDRATAMCTRSGMRLLQTDCALTRTRFQIATGDRENAYQTLCFARDLVVATNYHVRRASVNALRLELATP
jgi:tetratricopeptide (TPR) repeat protein